MKTPNILFNNCKELINLYLSKGDKINWPREIKIGKKLLSQFPEMDFWLGYDPQTKFKSLAVFLTKSGQKELNKEYSLYLLTKPIPTLVLEDKPVVVIEEKQIKKENRTLKDFVDDVL